MVVTFASVLVGTNPQTGICNRQWRPTSGHAPSRRGVDRRRDVSVGLGSQPGSIVAARPDVQGGYRYLGVVAQYSCRLGTQLEQSEGAFRRFASVIHQVACDV